MLHKEELRIVELFRTQPFSEITLQEIMQRLRKKSYNWTYLAVQKLSKKGILDTRKIGKTIVAKINLDSPETITYLIHVERLKVNNSNKNIVDKIKKVTPFFIFLENKTNKTVIVENNEVKSKILEKGIIILTKEEFKKQLLSAGENAAKSLVRDHLLLNGAESYYDILLEVFRHGIRY